MRRRHAFQRSSTIRDVLRHSTAYSYGDEDTVRDAYECEPESVWVRVEGSRGVGEVLRRVAVGAEFQAFRLRESLQQKRPAEPGAAADGGRDPGSS